MAETKRYTIAPVGVGRPDYSMNVEYSVNPVIRSKQVRWFWTVSAVIPAGVIPGFILTFPKPGGGLSWWATKIPIVLKDISLSTDKNALLDAEFERIDWPTFPIPPILGIVSIKEKIGYDGVEMHFREGHRVVEGYMYVMAAQEGSGLPWLASINVYGTQGPVESV
jgi:hypothetical protein